jgi:hypothetical protein
VVARCAHFSLIPDMVASSLLVMTSGRLFCERFSERLSLAILPCPVEFLRWSITSSGMRVRMPEPPHAGCERWFAMLH